MERETPNPGGAGLSAGHGLAELLPVVYVELRRLAARHMRGERHSHTLQPTALVHELYLRLSADASLRCQSRAHFFGIAAVSMRRILVEHARRRAARKRQAPLCAEAPLLQRDVDVLALDEALEQLAQTDPQRSRIVELRFFGGLTVLETAEVLGVSEATVARGWRLARAWLLRRLRASPADLAD